MLNFFYYLFRWTSWFKNLPRRVSITSIGLTGYVSSLDKAIAEEKGLKPLNRFEKWLYRDIIQIEKECRRNIFRRVVLKELGEDIS